MLAWRAERGSIYLLGWLTLLCIQLWTLLNEAKVPEIPWHRVEETIHRLRDRKMLKWIYHMQLVHLASNSVSKRTQKILPSLRNTLVREHLESTIVSEHLLQASSNGGK